MVNNEKIRSEAESVIMSKVEELEKRLSDNEFDT